MDTELDNFRKEAIAKWNCINNGDAKTANKHYEAMNIIYKKMKENNSLGKLLELISDLSDEVVLEASAILLKENCELARAALTQLAGKRGLIAFTAQMVLEETERLQ
ncbi:hypothetical protein SAMN02910339_01078 [Lachnospiraceae bacterium YSD2013]|nr:hypothetical protein SAMN02910339_01078 [Lachnospiraceae bacterium YSD2013]